MAKSYKATLDVSVWKQHTCVCCGSKYRYHLERKATGQGGTEDAALQAAVKSAEELAQTDVDMHPCPSCGCVQPDMVASMRSPYYGWGAAIAGIGTAVALIVGLAHGWHLSTSAIVATSSIGLGLAIAFIGSAKNPNSSLAANTSRAQESVDDKKLFLDERGKMSQEDPSLLIPSGFSGKSLMGLVLFAALVVVAAMPLVMAKANGWVTNDNWYPAVVGPGDESTLYITQTVRSVKGYWNGAVTADVTNAAEIGQPGLTMSGTTKTSTWGNTISGKSVSSSTHRIWGKFPIPNRPELVGKTLDLDVKANLNFPAEQQGGFMNANQSFQERANVVLSPAGAGTLYHRSFWIGESAAIFGSLVAWFMLAGAASAIGAQAHPHKVTPFEADAPVFDE